MSYVIAWAKAFLLTALVEVVVAGFILRRIELPSGDVTGSLPVAEGRRSSQATPATFAGRRPGGALGTSTLPAAMPRVRLCTILFYANLASHPAVWFIFPALDLRYTTMVLAAEIWAVCSEALFYAVVFPRLGLGRAAGVSLIANACSFGLGLALRSLTGWV